MQAAEAGGDVVALFARVVGLDDEFVAFGGVVAGGEDMGMEERGDQGEEGEGRDAEGGFGGDSVYGCLALVGGVVEGYWWIVVVVSVGEDVLIHVLSAGSGRATKADVGDAVGDGIRVEFG